MPPATNSVPANYELSLVTTNPGKVREVRELFSGNINHIDQELQELATNDIHMLVKNKAQTACNKLNELEKKLPLFVDDSGIFLQAYQNFPGTQTKFVVNSIGLEGIMKLLRGKERQAYFQTSICYTEDGQNFKIFDGKVQGKISKKIVRPVDSDLPYDSVFIPEGYKQTFSQLEIKPQLSHRARALEKLESYLNSQKNK